MRAVNGPQPLEPTKDELKTAVFRCSTEHAAKTGGILSACAGHENDKKLLLPRWKSDSVVTFAFLEKTFLTAVDAECVERALTIAVHNWNSRQIGVRFQRVAQDERTVFVIAYRDRKRQCRKYAKAFFPNSDERVLWIYQPALSVGCGDFLANVLRHKLGHILGLRHENAVVLEKKNRSVQLAPPTSTPS
ncbi:hypothetical protein MFIFM68171_06575 [Madurella fahalii]|uniref:Peptidase metallopeptidase domain-containing protein n=1 Tax=Madurella fahalii TaxID=1157608 RepID=A0ABQ0GFP4_9PEZI